MSFFRVLYECHTGKVLSKDFDTYVEAYHFAVGCDSGASIVRGEKDSYGETMRVPGEKISPGTERL